MFDGHLTEEEMLEEHPLELAEIKAGTAKRPVDPGAFARRRRAFAVVYGVLTFVSLVTIYFFVTFEESAIATVPPIEDVVVFAPLTPTPLPTPLPTPTPRPTPTPLPTAAPEVKITWQDGPADIFAQACSACHSEATALGDLDLSSYQGALAGGASGSVIEPGDPDTSQLVNLILSGDHPGQLSEDELDRIRQWIEDGALEAPSSSAEETEPIAAPETRVTWQDVAGLFEQKCAACHSETTALGGLDLSSYQTTLTGGDSGPIVQAGDPEASGLVTLQAQGGHPGQFDENELGQILQWIEDGALEN
jgi:mono/diheme cytochrome c family protein